MSGSFSDTAFGKDTAFSSAAFDFGGAAPVVSVGGHYGKKRRERDFSEDREARHRLREQIRDAIEGPQAAVVQTAISEYIRPQKQDARLLSLDERIDWDKIYRNLEMVEATMLMHIAWAEDDDDEDLLLLNG